MKLRLFLFLFLFLFLLLLLAAVPAASSPPVHDDVYIRFIENRGRRPVQGRHHDHV